MCKTKILLGVNNRNRYVVHSKYEEIFCLFVVKCNCLKIKAGGQLYFYFIPSFIDMLFTLMKVLV